LRTAEKASRTLDDFTVRVRLSSSVPIRNLYSPSHDIGITRKGDREAVIGFEEERSLLDRDFVLYYGVSEKEFAVNALTHAVPGEDGFFMMMIAPTADPVLAEVLPKDVTFVIDTSGSMTGEKIRQVREALAYCVNSLNQDDRFNLIRFSTDVEALHGGLVAASEPNIRKAVTFIDSLRARGGTHIDGALRQALGVRPDKARTHIVAFLTDGLPTIGEVDPAQILRNVSNAWVENTRVFVFGVGDNVNAHLLDQIAGNTGGAAQYVKPGEDIEVAVSSFYDKVSHPVLANPKLAVDRVKTLQVHPKHLPDLFCGGQVTVFGRYRGSGHVAVTLSGLVGGKKHEFVYEVTFPEKQPRNDFIPRLWATRKVGYLLDEIRLHGEDKELKDEVIRLSREYGIMTPYTSYLVLENDKAYTDHGIERRQKRENLTGALRKPGGWFGRRGRQAEESAEGARRSPVSTQAESADAPAPTVLPLFGDADHDAAEISGNLSRRKGDLYRAGEDETRQYFSTTDGRDAIALSESIAEYKQALGPQTAEPPALKHIGRRTFYLIDGVWTDRAYHQRMKTRRLAYASDAYFEFLRRHPDLKACFALGPKLIVCLEDGTAVRVE
jgi:Ca-activated chloride channel family protein